MRNLGLGFLVGPNSKLLTSKPREIIFFARLKLFPNINNLEIFFFFNKQ